jgi:hypothetical protein
MGVIVRDVHLVWDKLRVYRLGFRGSIRNAIWRLVSVGSFLSLRRTVLQVVAEYLHLSFLF